MWWNKLCHDHFYVYVLLQYSYKLGVVNCKKFLIGKLTSRDFDPYCWVPPINFPLIPIGRLKAVSNLEATKWTCLYKSYSNQKIIVIIEIFRVWLSSGDTSLCLRPCVLMRAVLTAWLFIPELGQGVPIGFGHFGFFWGKNIVVLLILVTTSKNDSWNSCNVLMVQWAKFLVCHKSFWNYESCT